MYEIMMWTTWRKKRNKEVEVELCSNPAVRMKTRHHHFARVEFFVQGMIVVPISRRRDEEEMELLMITEEVRFDLD